MHAVQRRRCLERSATTRIGNRRRARAIAQHPQASPREETALRLGSQGRAAPARASKAQRRPSGQHPPDAAAAPASDVLRRHGHALPRIRRANEVLGPGSYNPGEYGGFGNAKPTTPGFGHAQRVFSGNSALLDGPSPAEYVVKDDRMCSNVPIQASSGPMRSKTAGSQDKRESRTRRGRAPT